MNSQSQRVLTADLPAADHDHTLHLRKLLAEIGGHFGVKAVEKGLFFEIFLDHDIPSLFRCKRKKFQQLLTMLLHISMNRLQSGGIVLHVHLKPFGPDQFLAEINLTEHKKGSGIHNAPALAHSPEQPSALHIMQAHTLAYELEGAMSIQPAAEGLNRYCIHLPLDSMYACPLPRMGSSLPHGKEFGYSDIVGLLYISNLPSTFTAGRTRGHFMGLKNVLSVSQYDEQETTSPRRGCWLELQRPFAPAMNHLAKMEVEGERLQVTFMGHRVKEAGVVNH